MTRRGPEQTASPQRNFTLTTAERVQAIVTGAPAWARRRKRIEDLFALILDAHRAGRAREAKKHLAEAAKLVADHNAYYPIEANLPMDPETSRVMDGGEPWKPMPRPTIEAIVAAADAEANVVPMSLAWSDDDGALSVSFEVDEERYTLRLDDDALTCATREREIAHVATIDIEEIACEPALAIVTVETKTVRFPFELDAAFAKVIAAELGARLRAMRAQARAYR